MFNLQSAVLFFEHSFILLDLIDLVENNIVLNLQLRCFFFEVFHLQFILFDILDVLSLFLLKLVFQLYFLIVHLMVLLFEFRIFETAVLDLSLALFFDLVKIGSKLLFMGLRCALLKRCYLLLFFHQLFLFQFKTKLPIFDGSFQIYFLLYEHSVVSLNRFNFFYFFMKELVKFI
jgi:hypothetical protein